MPTTTAPVMDLSKIDFAALARKFKESKHKNTDLEVLKAAIRAQLEKLIRLNKTRADFAEKFEELIESYNAGSRNIEELLQELLNLSRRRRGGAMDSTRQQSNTSPGKRCRASRRPRRIPTPPTSKSIQPRSCHSALPKYQPVAPPMRTPAFAGPAQPFSLVAPAPAALLPIAPPAHSPGGR